MGQLDNDNDFSTFKVLLEEENIKKQKKVKEKQIATKEKVLEKTRKELHIISKVKWAELEDDSDSDSMLDFESIEEPQEEEEEVIEIVYNNVSNQKKTETDSQKNQHKSQKDFEFNIPSKTQLTSVSPNNNTSRDESKITRSKMIKEKLLSMKKKEALESESSQKSNKKPTKSEKKEAKKQFEKR